MKQIFTSNDLLKYLYKEMIPEEEKALKKQLLTDVSLSQELHELLDGISILENAEVNPGNALVQDLKHRLHLNEEEHSI